MCRPGGTKDAVRPRLGDVGIRIRSAPLAPGTGSGESVAVAGWVFVSTSWAACRSADLEERRGRAPQRNARRRGARPSRAERTRIRAPGDRAGACRRRSISTYLAGLRDDRISGIVWRISILVKSRIWSVEALEVLYVHGREACSILVSEEAC